MSTTTVTETEAELDLLMADARPPAGGPCAACGEAILLDEEAGYDVWDRLVHAACRAWTVWEAPPALRWPWPEDAVARHR